MAKLFYFIDRHNLPEQSDQGNKKFGFIKKANGEIDSDNFRITSSFDITSDTPAYAMLRGTILLQPQGTLNSGKVNLIIKPIEQADIKLPIKYIIYRGLNTTDFLTNANIAAAGNQVKTSGSELLDEMQHIQQDRAQGVAIPISALFGHNLQADANILLDEFFYKRHTLPSQLFTIPNERNGVDLGGIELGNFASGEVGIDIILENPEYEPDVVMAKLAAYEIKITDANDVARTRWEKEQVRHFVDPAAFYGLHHDIEDGIGYRENKVKVTGENTNDIYEKILKPFAFARANQVYLDIRNENGYSYNYYQNYNAADNDARELRIAEGNNNLALTEYYTEDWPVHIVEVANPSNTDNENYIKLSLRTNNNESPLLIGWNAKLMEASIVDPPLDNDNTVTNRAYFVDNYFLYPSHPFSPDTPGFTNGVTIVTPNLIVDNVGRQIPVIVRLDYTKSFRLNGGADPFPQDHPTDYIFGPVNSQIPWDTENNVQWIGSAHYKYFDGWLNQCYFSIDHGFEITRIDVPRNRLTLRSHVQDMIPLMDTQGAIRISETVILVVKSAIHNTINTVIEIDSIIDTENPNLKPDLSAIGISIGSLVFCTNYFKAIIDYANQDLYVENFDISQYNSFLVGNPRFDNRVTIDIRFKLGTTPTTHQLRDPGFVLNGTSTQVTLAATTPLEKKGIACVMQSGVVSETDVIEGSEAPDNDNALFYAFPQYYYAKTGSVDTRFFNYRGGTSNQGSFFDILKRKNSKINIIRSSIASTPIRYLLAFQSTKFLKNENFLLLALKKKEIQDLITLTNSSNPPVSNDFSNYHIKTFKLVNVQLKRDREGELFLACNLIIAGLDQEGNYKETPRNKGVEIHSKDGQLFSSHLYAQDIQTPQVDYKVHFRRPDSKTYQKHYGFDWMRGDYIAESDSTASRGGICVAHDSSITKDEAQDQLKQEYTPIELDSTTYYVPWLSIYENHDVVMAGGDAKAAKFKKHSVILCLKTEIDAGAVIGDQIIRFDAPDGLEIDCSKVNKKNKVRNLNTNEIYVRHAHNALIEVKCSQKSSLNRKIYAYNQNNRLVGALNVFRNIRNFRLPIRLVEVNFTGTLSQTVNLPTGNTNINYDFNGNTYNVVSTDPNISSNSGTISPHLASWRRYIRTKSNEIKSHFHQYLFDFELNPTARDINVNLGNYNVGTPVTDPRNGNDLVKSSIKGVVNPGTAGIQISLDYITLVEGLINIYEDSFSPQQRGSEIPIFLMPVKCIDPKQTVEGFSPPPDQFGRYVVLCGTPNVNEIRYLVAHEVSHALDLLHSFIKPSEEPVERAFEQYFTDNIMDYIDATKGIQDKISSWKWQWEKVQNKNPDLEIK